MSTPKTLRKHVQHAIRHYLQDMGATEPEDLYRRLLDQVEPPLIRETLRHTAGNQSRAARILGITRNTLRDKMRRHDIDL